MKLSSAAVSPSIIVCLGQMLYSNQTLPSSLISRVEKAYELSSVSDIIYDLSLNRSHSEEQPQQQHHDSVGIQSRELAIIFSGSDTAQCGITEATAMEHVFKQLIHPKPIPSIISTIVVVKEERSKNTIENALYCRDIIKGLITSSRDSNIHIMLVTSDYHMPRAKLLFDYICCINNVDPDDDDYNHHNNTITVTCCPANSLHRRFIENSDGVLCSYRPRVDRSDDSNEWTLSERLDWELNALLSVNSHMGKYGLEAISKDHITRAIQQLKVMNYTYDDSMDIDR